MTWEQGQFRNVETKAQECLQLCPCMGSDILRINETLRNHSQSMAFTAISSSVILKGNRQYRQAICAHIRVAATEPHIC